MTLVLSLYLSRIFLKLTLAAAAGLAVLVQLIDLIDAAPDILDRGQGAQGIAYYASLRLPMILDQVLPLSVLIGALLTFAILARNSEITALRACGYTVGRVVLLLLPTALLLSVAHLVIGDRMVPRLQTDLAGWWAATEPAVPENQEAREPAWLRVEGSLVSIARVLEDGRRLEGVRIYQRDADNVATSRIVAQRAVFDGGTWRLENAVATRFAAGAFDAQPPQDAVWRVGLRPGNVVEALTPMGDVSAASARAILAGNRVGSGSPAFYRTALQRTFAEPATSLVMLLLAAPAAIASRRSGESGKKLALALGLGLVFLLSDGILTALGQAAAVPAPVAAWGPLALFACLGGLILHRLERA